MTDANPAVSRGQFIKNTTKAVSSSSAPAACSLRWMEWLSLRVRPRATSLRVAYIAESLAVVVYSAIIKNFSSFKGLQNKDYFVAALKNEKDHKAFLASALGAKKPSGFKLHIPKAAVKSTKALTSTGVALESAFVETYLGAVNTLSSTELKLTAAKVAANEASHFSFFDAANGGHGVLPSLPGTITAKTAAATLTKDGFIS